MNKLDFEKALTEFAHDLMTKARADGTKLEDSVRVFKEVREFFSILTAGQPAGDKVPGRRSTMGGMRKRIAAAGGSNGRAQPAISNTGD